jgi:hypothetical protein
VLSALAYGGGYCVAADPVAQAIRHDSIVAQVPGLSVGVPAPASLLDHGAGAGVGERDPELDDRVTGNARPGNPLAFVDHELDSLEALSLSIVPITHADEASPVLLEESLGALLAGLEMQSHSRGVRSEPCGCCPRTEKDLGKRASCGPARLVS